MTQNVLTSFLVVEMYVKPCIVEDSRKSFNPSMVKVGGELFDKLFGTTQRVTKPQPLTLQMKCNDKLC